MCVREFVRCERGVGTVWGLTWLILFVGICGLAVDITNGFRNRTMLQATADSAALAAVIDLPDQGAAVATAVAYSGANQPTGSYGTVLHPQDVEVGVWDEDNRQFLTSGYPANAVLNAARVTLSQSAQNNNGVPVHLLRVIGLTSWNVRARAVATGFYPKCLRNGMTAAGIVDISSNNTFVNEICIHGQQGVEMQNHNYHEAGVEVTMRDYADLTLPSGGMDSNPGLREALGEQNKVPRLVNDLPDIMADFLDLSSGIHPSYIDTSQPVISINNGFDLGKMAPHRVYYGTCPPNTKLKIPAGAVVQKAVLIADCGIQIGAGAMLFDVVLGSRSGGGNAGINKAIIESAAGAVIGLPDGCAPGGGVQLFSNATMKFSSSTSFNGVQMVATGDIELGALAMGVNGISAEAGGNIVMTSNNAFGLCQGSVPMLRRYFHWHLVQ